MAEQYTVYLVIERTSPEERNAGLDCEDLRYKTSDVMLALRKIVELSDTLFNWHMSGCPVEGFVYDESDYEVLR